MSSAETIFQIDPPFAILTFNRPEARNAMTWAMYDALVDVCERVDADPQVRVLILRGAGGKAFVSGTDISQFQSFSNPNDAIEYEKKISSVLSRLTGPKPTITQIEGFAAGAGCGIAATCDLRVATPGRPRNPDARTRALRVDRTFGRLVDLTAPPREGDAVHRPARARAEAGRHRPLNRVVPKRRSSGGDDAAARLPPTRR